MSSFAEALDRLGITPQPGQTARSAQSYAPARSQQRAQSPIAPNVANIKFPNAVKLNVTPAGGALGIEDDGFSVGGLFKGAGMGLLKALDTGRSYGVSGIKELTDTIYGSRVGAALDSVMGVSDEERAKALENQTTGSWNDFLQQGKDGIGFREVMDSTSESQGTGSRGKGGPFSVAGFAGDVIADPLTYLTFGTSTAAGAAAKGSAKVAVADGSGKMLGKEILETAYEKGLQNIPEVKALAADAFVRGRGAITSRGLARAGIDDATREALGIPSLARTIGRDGIRIPGTRGVANVAEDLKGGFKNVARTSDVAQSVRKLAPNRLGSRNLSRIMFSRSATLGQKFDALAAHTTINKASAIARDWAATADRVILKDPALGAEFRRMTPETGRRITHELETGVVDGGVVDATRAKMTELLDQARALGVDVGEIDNYVPHMVTDEFRMLARKNPEAAKIVVGLQTDAGPTMRRVFGVRPGQNNQFLGETLVEGTIEEMNGIALKKLGTKVFVDDVRDTLPRYIGQMSEQIAREQQIRLLVDKGIVRELAVKQVTKQIPFDEAEQAAIREAKAQLKLARQNEKVALKDGTVLRRKELGVAREATQVRRAEIAREIDAIDMRLKGAARDRMVADTKLNRAMSKQESIQHSLDEWTAVVKAERGPLRRKALAQVKKLEAQLADTEANIARYTPSPGNEPYAVLTARREALAAEGLDLKAKADELLLKVNEPGAGPLPSDRRVAQASAALQAQQLKTAGLSDEAAQAASVFDATLAEQRLVVEELNLAEAELDKIWDQTTKLPDRDRGINQVLAEEYRTRVNVVRQILEREGLDDASKAMATLEAQAMMADIAAWKAKNQAVTMDVLLKQISQPKFQTETFPFVEQGMVRMGETMQIPGWLDEALKVEPVKANIFQANKFVREFYNLWKGYAILRPGFHVRNAYSGMFNIYLEAGAGSISSVRRAMAFDRLAMKHPENYMELATRRFGPEDAAMLNEAYMAMRATGAGQAAGEFTSNAFHRGKINPLSGDNALLKLNRRGGENIERKIRTAHAYDVLQRGGTLDQAIDTVNKWHFNYTDISQFDQNMKLAMPFWMFFSRNLALQGQTWVSKASKLNRTYMNVQRNWAAGEEDDTYVPEWFGDAGAIKMPNSNIPFMGRAEDGAQRYLFPDLPAAQAPAQFDKFTTPWTGQFLGDVGPVKVPFELLAGKQMFSGIPFKGSDQPVEAGVAGQALNALGLTPTHADGTPMIDDRLQYAINSFIPGAGQLDRYLGQGGDANAERQNYSLMAALTGIGVRENNDRTRQGEQYRRQQEAESEAQRRRALGL